VAEMAHGIAVRGSAKCSVASTAPKALFCIPTCEVGVDICQYHSLIEREHRAISQEQGDIPRFRSHKSDSLQPGNPLIEVQ